MQQMRTVSLYITLCLAFQCTWALDNGLGLTPQMGWNSWNHFHCGVNDALIRRTADAFIANGLDKHGYKYVNIDDCWAATRLPNGSIQPDLKAFPDMKSLGDYIHSKNLLFGIYSEAGVKTCAGRPGSMGYEVIDAQTYADWGVDYLKFDNCASEGLKPEVRYPFMRDALLRTGRPIFFSLCEWGNDDPPTWAYSVGNSWRTTGDIGDSWDSMISRADQNDKWWQYAYRGGWNDPDMLEVGNGGMSTTEYEAHFSLWALAKAPLLIGCDVTNMSNDTLQILRNDEVIAINQDRLGVQGHKINSNNGLEVWAGPLYDGSVAAILLNRGTTDAKITANWSDIGLKNEQSAAVRDLWAHKDLGSFKGSISATVPVHGVAMYKITPQ